MTGKRFGRLLILGPGAARGGRRTWHCQCDCGTTKDILRYNLKPNGIMSCGCLVREATIRRNTERHRPGHDRLHPSPTYRSWQSMWQRCTNTRHPAHQRYGGRGITICARWRLFLNFLADMGERPEGHSIERKDNDGNYEPANCKWATQFEQDNNKSTNVVVRANGKKQTVMQWARETGIYHQTIRKRLERGWAPERAINQPVRT